MTVAADIDLEQVDRDFEVAVRSRTADHDDRPRGAPFPKASGGALPPPLPGLGMVATVIVLCVGFAGTGACVVGLASALHTALELAWSLGQPDVRYDLTCTGAWFSAGAAGILLAIGLRRAAAPEPSDRDSTKL